MASEGANSPETCAQATSLEQYDLQGPSPGTESSIRTRSNSNTPKKTFNAAQLPSFGSPSPIASKKARRKQRKSSNRTTNSEGQHSEPDFSLHKLEPKKNSCVGRMPMSRCGSVTLAQASAQKPDPNHLTGKKYEQTRDQPSLEELSEFSQDTVRWSHFILKSKPSEKNPCGKGEDPATLTPSPPRIELPRATGAISSDELCDHAERDIKTSESRHEPKLSIKHSRASHELNSVFQGESPDYSHQHLNHDLQQEDNGKVGNCASGDDTIGRDRESYNDAPRTPLQKKSGKPPPEAAKNFSMQRELEKRSDRPCSRLAGKLKNGALADVHAHEHSSTHKDGRPPWRP